MIEAYHVSFVSIPLLGVYPTLQGLGTQAAVLAMVISGIWLSRRQALAS
jgi:high-affinity iron transporter